MTHPIAKMINDLMTRIRDGDNYEYEVEMYGDNQSYTSLYMKVFYDGFFCETGEGDKGDENDAVMNRCENLIGGHNIITDHYKDSFDNPKFDYIFNRQIFSEYNIFTTQKYIDNYNTYHKTKFVKMINEIKKNEVIGAGFENLWEKSNLCEDVMWEIMSYI